MPDPKPTKEPLSKTPSWIMLGFVIGCIVTLTVRKDMDDREKPSPPPPTVATPKSSTPQLEAVPPAKAAPAQLSLSDMEAIFGRWQNRAIWRHELTEVAYWNPSTNKYSEFAEVLRSGEDLYLRSIPRLTRPLIEENPEPTAPIRFTELEETRAARRAPYIIQPR